MIRIAIVLVMFTATASAAPNKSSDGFAGYAGLKLRAAPGKPKELAKKWRAADTDNTSRRYTLKKNPPAFRGVKIDEAVLTVSKHLQVIVGFALKLSGERCAAIEKALDAAWGDANDLGGANKKLAWPGTRVDASLEHQGTDCLVYINSAAWDAVKDEYKKP